MNELWPHWLRLAWLVALPLLIWLSWQLWQRPHRSGRWQTLIPQRFHSALLIDGEQRSTRLPWLALVLGWLLALLALLGPAWQQVENKPLKRADPLVVVLDLSAEMLAADMPPSRLAQARRKVLDLLEARGDAQTGIVVYAGSAHSLVPLSDDLLTSRNLLEALQPAIMPVPGRRADLGVRQAKQLLRQGANDKGRILLITAQVDSKEYAAIRQMLAKADMQLDILGVGTQEGAPILQKDGSFLKDADGGILLPRLEESSLKLLASEMGGHYSRIRLDNQDMDHLQLLDGAQSTRQSVEPMRLQLWADAGHWLLLPLLLLAACASRRGWLFCLPLLLLMPRPVYAFEFIDLWLTPDQQGARLLQQNQPAAAAGHFDDPQWQGISLYGAGNYADAANRFTQDDRAIGHYNRANALARNGDLEAALDAYETALERQPDMAPALENKALIEELLRQQKQQQQSDGKQGENDQPQSGDQAQQNNPAGNQPQPENQQPSDDSSNGQQPQPEGQGQTGKPAQKPGQQGDTQSAEAADGNAKPDTAKPGEQSDKAGDTSTQATEEPLSSSPAKDRGAKSATGQSSTKDAQEGDDAATVNSENTEPLDDEKRQALEQWLRQIPDDPAELLRRKFWYEQQKRQENSP